MIFIINLLSLFRTKHISLVHIQKFRCDWPECGFVAQKRKFLISHKFKHTGRSPYKCKGCGYYARYKEFLKKHKCGHNRRDNYKINDYSNAEDFHTDEDMAEINRSEEQSIERNQNSDPNYNNDEESSASNGLFVEDIDVNEKANTGLTTDKAVNEINKSKGQPIERTENSDPKQNNYEEESGSEVNEVVNTRLTDDRSQPLNDRKESKLRSHKSFKQLKQKSNKCEFCEKSFKFIRDLIKHKTVHHSGVKVFECSYAGCEQHFQTFYQRLYSFVIPIYL